MSSKAILTHKTSHGTETIGKFLSFRLLKALRSTLKTWSLLYITGSSGHTPEHCQSADTLAHLPDESKERLAAALPYDYLSRYVHVECYEPFVRQHFVIIHVQPGPTSFMHRPFELNLRSIRLPPRQFQSRMCCPTIGTC